MAHSRVRVRIHHVCGVSYSYGYVRVISRAGEQAINRFFIFLLSQLFHAIRCVSDSLSWRRRVLNSYMLVYEWQGRARLARFVSAGSKRVNTYSVRPWLEIAPYHSRAVFFTSNNRYLTHSTSLLHHGCC